MSPRGVVRLTATDLQKYPHLAKKINVHEIPVKPLKKTVMKEKKSVTPKKTDPATRHHRMGFIALVAGTWMLSLVFAVVVLEAMW